MARSWMLIGLAAVTLLAALVLGSVGVAPADSPCATFGGALDGTTCRAHSTTSAYTFDAAFPADYAEPQPMLDYLTQTRDGFLNVSQMPGSTNLPYALDITSQAYRSGSAPRGTQSAVLEIFQNVGGAHPLTWYKSFNYNMDTRAPITFDTLFLPGSKPLPVILPIVQREIDKQLGNPVAISAGDGVDPKNYDNFAITNDELIFFFGQDELLPSVAGATVARVPRAAVASMLAPLPK